MLRTHLQVDLQVGPHVTLEITTAPGGISFATEPEGLRVRMWWSPTVLAPRDAEILHQVAAGSDRLYVTRELGGHRQRILYGLVTGFECNEGMVHVSALQPHESDSVIALTNATGSTTPYVPHTEGLAAGGPPPAV